MQDWFPSHSFYGLLLSDSMAHTWRFLTIQNPKAERPQGLVANKIPSDEAIDPVLVDQGRDVSLAFVHDPDLVTALSESTDSLVVEPGEFLDRLNFAFGVQSTLMVGNAWQRPRGGIGWIFIGFTSHVSLDEDDLRLMGQIVRVTARMAIFPEMVHEVARTERIGLSLRRNIVHDLKTPLTVIRGYAQTLLLPGVVDDPKTQRELLSGIVEQTDRLLDDLKDILMPLDDAWRPQPEEFDLSLVLQQAVIAERHTERAKNHRIQIDGMKEKCTVYLDRRKIRRVIENLVSNAVKYSPGTGKVVSIWVKTEGDTISIAVQDQGIGMSDIQLAKVLREGGRAVEGSLGIEGTGFGLDSCARVLDAHGGRLEAFSEPGQGSTFTAVFPRRIPI